MSAVMRVRDMQDAILRLKAERDCCVLAHAYQSQDIIEVADFVGDSYSLSVQAAKAPRSTIIMCGVRFMAETCKVLSPEKQVFLPNPLASCPMADQLDLAALGELQQTHPGYATVAYINTSSTLKTACDVCVTSSSAVKICRALDSDKVLFVPDPNLGRYVAQQLPEKEFAFFDGGCPYHKGVSEEEVRRAKALHPAAELLVHPECPPEVSALADYVGSTTGIMERAQTSTAREFIIGTENSIVEHLQFACAEKRFYPLSVGLSCVDMRATTLADVLGCLQSGTGEEIVLPSAVMAGAARCIKKMIELGG